MSSGNYTVLARKWRPQRFEQVVGQDAVVRTLANALRQQRIAHAYCFSGIRGVGKTTAARLLAKGLNCRNSPTPTAEPCGTCESCVEIERSRSMDVVELDAASQTGVDNIRELTEVTRYAPSRDRYRVFIIDEAHMLSTSAFNALLKTLEEPPPHVVFILATTEPNKILPTVLSRCQQYQFGRVSQGEIAAYLGKIAEAEQVTISADALALLATAADGSIRDGQSLLDKLIAFSGNEIDEQTVVDLLGLVERVLLFRAVDLIAAQDLPGVLGFVNEMVDRGVDLHQFTMDLLGHFRNLLVVRTVSDPGAILHLPESDLDRLRGQADAFEIDDLDRGFSLLAASEYRIKSAEQPRYHLEIVMARLARMPRLQPIEELIAAIEGGGGTSGPATGGSHNRRGSSPARGASGGPRARSTETSGSPAAASPRPAPESRDEPQRPAPVPPRPQPGREPVPQRAAATEPAAAEPAAAETTAPEPPVAAAGPRAPDGGDGASAAVSLEDEAPQLVSRLLQRIRDEVDAVHPMAGSVLGRVSGLRLAGERIVFQMPVSAGIFIRRLQEQEMLQLLGASAEKVLGRRVVAGVEADPHATGPLLAPPSEESEPAPRPGTPTPSRDAGPAEAPREERPAPVSSGTAAPGGRVEEEPPTPEDPPSMDGMFDDEPERPGPPSAPPPLRSIDGGGNGRAANGAGDHVAPPVTANRPEPPRPEPAGLRERVEGEPLVQEFLRAMRGEITSVEELEDER